MKIVDKIKICHGNAWKEKEALQRLIDAGYGELEYDIYMGTAYATAKTSNAYKFKQEKLTKGYEIVAEEAGMHRKSAHEGHVVYCALRKMQK